MLLPVYERLEDGAEILWNEHSGRTVKSIRALVQPKNRLVVFDDSESNRGGKRRSNKPLERPGMNPSLPSERASAGRSAASR